MKIKKRYIRYLVKDIALHRKLRVVWWNIKHVLSFRKGPLWGPFPTYAKIEIDQRCNLRCLIGDTNILMADYSWKKMKDVVLGDMVLGIEKPERKGGHYKFVSSKVGKIYPAVEENIGELMLENGVSLCGTLNHPILTKHDRWISMEKLTNSNPPKFTAVPIIFEENTDYLLGYLNGAWKSDGTIGRYLYDDGEHCIGRFTVKDKEFIDFTEYCMNQLGLSFRRKKISWNSPSVEEMIIITDSEKLKDLEQYLIIPNDISMDWARGFLAGFYDGDGTFDGASLRINNTHMELVSLISKCFDILEFGYSINKYERENPKHNDIYIITLLGGQRERIRFFSSCRPKIPRKYRITSTQSGTEKVKSVNRIGRGLVYNLETETGNYIANGLIVHNCTFCFRDSGITDNSFMTLEQFKEVIKKLGPGLCEVWSHGFGEPMIHPQFFEMMEYLREEGIMWGLATNGTFLTEDKRKRLLELQPAQVRLSIDAADKDVYNNIRLGADYDDVVSKFRETIKLRNIMYPKGTKHRPIMVLYCVLTMDTLDQVPKLIELKEQIGADIISFSDLAWNNDFKASTKDKAVRQNLSEEELKKLFAYADNNSGVSFTFNHGDIRECSYTKNHIYIHANGDVYTCTCTPGFIPPLANIFTDFVDWKEVYKFYSDSDEWNTLRETSLKGEFDSAVCRACLQWGTDLKDVI